MTITEIRKLNKKNGYYLFSPKTMKFFRSKVVSRAYDNYFITQEAFGGKLDYTIKRAKEKDGSIETIGDRYTSKEEALKVMRLIIACHNRKGVTS